MKNIFRIATLMAVLNTTSAFAANGAESGGFSLIGWIFIGFLAVIVAFQFVPSVIMYGSMMLGVFGKAQSHKGATDNRKSAALD